MKERFTGKRKCSILIAFLICFVMLAECAVPAFAADNLDTGKESVSVEAIESEGEIADDLIDSDTIVDQQIESEEVPKLDAAVGPLSKDGYTLLSADDLDLVCDYQYDVYDCWTEDSRIATATLEEGYYYDTIFVEGFVPGETVLYLETDRGTFSYTITVESDFYFEKTVYNLNRDDVITLSMPERYECTWSTSDKFVAWVSVSGTESTAKVYADRSGTAVVTVTNEFGETAQVTINVTYNGPEFTLGGSTNPEIVVYNDAEVSFGSLDGPYEDYSWYDCDVVFKDPKIAKLRIDEDDSSIAHIEGLKTGNTKMTITNYYGEVIVCDIRVCGHIDRISFEKEKYVMYVGSSFTPKYDVSPADHNNKLTYKYIKSYISVSENGVVTALKPGTTTLKAYPQYGIGYAECTIEVRRPKFEKTEYTLYKNKKLTLKLYGKNSSTVWKSSNPDIATVSSKGVVTAKRSGTVEITADTNGYKAYADVTVKNPYLNKKTVSIYPNGTYSLKVYGSSGTIKWTSSNTSVATVSKGKITPKKPGKAIITATVSGVKLKCTVTVKKPKISKTSVSLYPSGTATLRVTGAKGTVKWTTSNSSVATVSKGKITPKKPGKVTITATASGVKLKCTVTVKKPKISRTSISMYPNNTAYVYVTGAKGYIKWKSSNKNVVKVSDGDIIPVNAGTATVTAVANGVVLKCKVVVKSPKLSVTYKELVEKQSFKLKITGGKGKVKWSSSNKSVASVSSTGKVTAKKAGTATIRAKVNGRTLSCKVTVKRNQVTYSVSTNPYDYYYGEPAVELSKAYYDGNTLKVNLWVINNRMFYAQKFDWIELDIYDDDYNLIASKTFYDVPLKINSYSSKKISLTFSGSSLKQKNAILNDGITWYYTYYYTYLY